MTTAYRSAEIDPDTLSRLQARYRDAKLRKQFDTLQLPSGPETGAPVLLGSHRGAYDDAGIRAGKDKLSHNGLFARVL